MVGQFLQFFRKDPTLLLTEQLTATIGDHLKLTNTNAYHTIHHAPPVQYYFDPARTKASHFPWVGIKQFLFSVAAFAWISTYVLVVASAIWLRRKDKQTPRPFRMPLFPFLPAVGLIGMVLVLFFSGRDTLLVGGGLFVSCLIYSLVVLSLRARRVQQ